MADQPKRSEEALGARLKELERAVHSLEQTVQGTDTTVKAILAAVTSGTGTGGTGSGGSTGTGSGGTGTGSGGTASGGSTTGSGGGTASGGSGSGSGSSSGSGSGSGTGPTYPSTLQQLADASASDYNVSSATRIKFLQTALGLLTDAMTKDGSIPAELIPPITKVILDVLDFIDRGLSAGDLLTLTAVKQQIAPLLEEVTPVVQPGLFAARRAIPGGK
jgi:hypothetical protein